MLAEPTRLWHTAPTLATVVELDTVVCIATWAKPRTWALNTTLPSDTAVVVLLAASQEAVVAAEASTKALLAAESPDTAGLQVVLLVMAPLRAQAAPKSGRRT